MGAFSIWHWIIIFVIIVPPILGIIRAVGNKSVLHAICSAIIPLYGLFYFFIGRKK